MDNWIKHFPPVGREDMQNIGMCVDWRRSFITTSVNPFYDSFIKWQFNILKKKGKLHYGKKNIIFSILNNQPCAGHDRSIGEDVNPKEYVAIKIKLLDFPEVLKEHANKEVYLVAATLRPETMVG